MPRLLKPTRDNRLESVLFALKPGVLPDTSEITEANILKWIRQNGDFIQDKSLIYKIACTEDLAQDSEQAMFFSRLTREPTQFDKIRRAFAYRYLSVDLVLHERRAGVLPFSARDDSLLQILAWQGVSLACGLQWFADWVAPYLANLLKTSEVHEYFANLEDKPAHFFFSTLQAILVTRNWPSFNPSEVENAGVYGRILQCAGDEAGFRVALSDYCDYRVAQCLGYAGIDAEKRRRPSQLESIVDMMSWSRVFPAELFTLQYAYQMSTGKSLSLESDHPLMHTALMTEPFPNLEPLYEDEMTQKMQAFGLKSFGDQWKLREPVVIK